MKTQKAYGLWTSVFTPQLLSGAVNMSEPRWDRNSDSLVWLEQKDGQGTLMVCDDSGDSPRELTFGQNVRGKIGYGGGNFCVSNGLVVFAGNEGKLFRQEIADGFCTAITPGFGQSASPQISPNGKWIVFVYELDGENGLALVPTDGSRWPQKLVSGADFYFDPRWSPDGKLLSWICWDHPNMPWDGSILQLTTVSEKALSQGQTGKIRTIAGGKNISVLQPEFSPQGDKLAYLSDESGWYNLHLYDLESKKSLPLLEKKAEYGGPTWVLGMRWYDWMPDGQELIAIKNERGFCILQCIDAKSGHAFSPEGFQKQYSYLESIHVSSKGKIALLAADPGTPKRLLRVSIKKRVPAVQVLRRSANEQIPKSYISYPESVLPKNQKGQSVHGLFFPPKNPQFESGGLPPLIIQIHGGPTSQVFPFLNGEIQYFTSRGFAFLNLNYRGSSGYGREYRDLLKGQWGVVDVEDAVFVASHLVEQKRVDPERLVIKGGSAGGYTVLQAMVRHPDFFCAGICSYGISNLFNLVKDTHKFELHYTDSLIGVLPEAMALFHERSPLFSADQIRHPLLLFQGEEDTVVPKNQAEAIIEALRQNGIPHEYHLFPGEGHGWRKQRTILRYFEEMSIFLEKYIVFAR
ncbi:MAG: S9 family peptidase [SAR324 cluster bacterium]|nr:S9 family peptidase [SAR324 cluster bacterium]